MRIVRVARSDGPAFGVVEQGYVLLLEGHPFGEVRVTDQVAPLDQVPLLAPVIPSKILCVGRNYADHAAEMGGEVPDQPTIFSKLTTSVVGPGAAIKLPSLSQDVQHEAELAVVVGRLTRKASIDEARQSVLGYTCANDVTARDLQRRDGQFTRGKSFDTFCPLGPWIETDVDPSAGLRIQCRVDGEVRQDGSTADMVFGVAELVAYCSAFATLVPGDVILTGTPSGVGSIVAGQTVEVEIEGIGTLSNPAAVDDGA